jgi:hypothetical protein
MRHRSQRELRAFDRDPDTVFGTGWIEHCDGDGFAVFAQRGTYLICGPDSKSDKASTEVESIFSWIIGCSQDLKRNRTT